MSSQGSRGSSGAPPNTTDAVEEETLGDMFELELAEEGGQVMVLPPTEDDETASTLTIQSLEELMGTLGGDTDSIGDKLWIAGLVLTVVVVVSISVTLFLDVSFLAPELDTLTPRHVRVALVPEGAGLAPTDSKRYMYWHTPSIQANSVVSYGFAANALSTTRTNSENKDRFVSLDTSEGAVSDVLLGGQDLVLSPNRRYWYIVGNGAGNESPAQTFRTYKYPGTSAATPYTSPAVDGRMTMAFVSMVGRGDFAAQTLSDIEGDRSVDLVLVGGGLAYAEGNPDAWNEYGDLWDGIAQEIPVHAIAGPSEYEASDGNFTAFEGRWFTDSEHWDYWSVVAENVRVIGVSNLALQDVLDGISTNFTEGSAIWNFIDGELQTAAASRDEIPWVVFMGYWPMYSATDLNSAGRVLQPPVAVAPVAGQAALRGALEDLLISYGVDVCLWGGTGAYERTYPLQTDGTYAPQPGDTDTVFVNPLGPIHVGAGSAGGGPNNIPTPGRTDPSDANSFTLDGVPYAPVDDPVTKLDGVDDWNAYWDPQPGYVQLHAHSNVSLAITWRPHGLEPADAPLDQVYIVRGATSCPESCSEHGSCEPSGEGSSYACVCDEGWEGAACSRLPLARDTTPWFTAPLIVTIVLGAMCIVFADDVRTRVQSGQPEGNTVLSPTAEQMERMLGAGAPAGGSLPSPSTASVSASGVSGSEAGQRNGAADAGPSSPEVARVPGSGRRRGGRRRRGRPAAPTGAVGINTTETVDENGLVTITFDDLLAEAEAAAAEIQGSGGDEEAS